MRSALALSFALSLSLALPVACLAQTAKPPVAAKAKAAKAVKKKAPVEHHEPEVIEEERMAVTPHVMVGDSHCEFGHRIRVDAHPTLAGRFVLEHRGAKHVLTPHPTTTGVVRLEARHTGLVWLQVPVKSMLLDARKGQRVADNCMHAKQVAEVEATREQSATLQ